MTDKELDEQLRERRAQIADLEASLEQDYRQSSSITPTKMDAPAIEMRGRRMTSGKGMTKGQEMWTLTASGRPDIAKIDPQVRKIAELQGDRRIDFIRAVGEAAMRLTDEQRTILVGRGPGESS